MKIEAPKMSSLIEVILVIYSFSESILLGIFVLGYIILIRDKYDNIKTQLFACLSEDKKTERLKPPKFEETPQRIYPYGKFCIEEYKGPFFTIMNSEEQIIPTVFFSLKQAKKEIDDYESLQS